MKSEQIHNRMDIIDSRDVIERIDKLEDILSDDFKCPDCEQSEPIPEFGENEVCPHCGEGVFMDLEEEKQELKILRDLSEQCEGYAPDWRYGEALIRDSYFEEYAQDLAEDIGLINPDAHWPNNCINWEWAARELKMDYTCVDFDGVDYWIRS